MEDTKEDLVDRKKRRLERKHTKFILEVIFMAVIGFLVLYPFFLFFFNYLS